MLEKSRVDLAKYRIENAEQDYLAAKDLLATGHYKAANNRAYYSIFHSIRAVLALDGVDFKKHSSVIAYFNMNYIKTGIFDKRYYRIISDASIIRNESDYNDFYVATKQEAEEQIANANDFWNAVVKFVENKTIDA